MKTLSEQHPEVRENLVQRGYRASVVKVLTLMGCELVDI